MQRSLEPISTNKLERLRYIQLAAELRSAIERNLSDDRLANEDLGRINYTFDANVCLFFLDPVSERHHIRIFPDELTQDGDTVNAGTMICTAEFLFSRELAGQWRYPCYIAPGHAKEFVDRARKKYEELSRTTPSDGPDSDGIPYELVESVKRLATRIRHVPSDPRYCDEQVLTQIAREVIGVVDKISSCMETNAAFIAATFARLFRAGTLQPIARHRLATPGIFSPTVDQLAPFKDVILKYSQGRKSEMAVANDAEALWLITKLNEIGSDPRRQKLERFVLVTADERLQFAYADWHANQRDRKKIFYGLRSITQYLPIINIEEMNNRIDDDNHIYDIQSSLDFLLSNFKDTDDEYPYFLPISVNQATSYIEFRGNSEAKSNTSKWNRLLRGLSQDIEAFDIAKFRAIQSHWIDLSRQVLSLNATFLTTRTRALTDFAVALEDSQAVRNSIRHFMDDSCRAFETGHISANLHFSLTAKRTKEKSKREPEGAGLFLVSFDFDDWLDGATSVRSYLRTMFIDEPLKSSLERVDRLVSSIEKTHDDPRGLFLAGCVAFRCSQWEAARFYAYRARSVLDSLANSDKEPDDIEPLSQELDIFLLTAIRYTFPERLNELVLKKRGEWDDVLHRVLENAHGDFALARILAERCTLHTQMAFLQRSTGDPDTAGLVFVDTERAKALTYAKLAWDHLVQVADDRNGESVDHQVVRSSTVFAIAGALSGLILLNYFGTLPQNLEERFVGAVLEALRAVVGLPEGEEVQVPAELPGESPAPKLYMTTVHILQSALLNSRSAAFRTEISAAHEKLRNHIQSDHEWPTPWDAVLIPYVSTQLQRLL